MRLRLRHSLNTLLLSARDIYVARLFLLLSLTISSLLPALLLALTTLILGRSRSLFFLFPLFVLLFWAFILIGRWCARIVRDIRSGNPTPIPALWADVGIQTSPFPACRPPASWKYIASGLGVLITLPGFIGWGKHILLVMVLLVPILPLLTISLILYPILNREDPSSYSNRDPDSTVDVTRPMNGAQPRPDETVAAGADTNPAGLLWSPQNRQALIMDILAGYLSVDDASERFGITSSELESWITEHERLSPGSQNPGDMPKEPDHPA